MNFVSHHSLSLCCMCCLVALRYERYRVVFSEESFGPIGMARSMYGCGMIRPEDTVSSALVSSEERGTES